MNVSNKETRTDSQIESEMDINKSLSTHNKYYRIIEVVTYTNTQNLNFNFKTFSEAEPKKEKKKRKKAHTCLLFQHISVKNFGLCSVDGVQVQSNR